MVQEWGSDFKESTVVLGGVSFKLRSKRRAIMKL
jgi:chromosome segregation ATPase